MKYSAQLTIATYSDDDESEILATTGQPSIPTTSLIGAINAATPDGDSSGEVYAIWRCGDLDDLTQRAGWAKPDAVYMVSAYGDPMKLDDKYRSMIAL